MGIPYYVTLPAICGILRRGWPPPLRVGEQLHRRRFGKMKRMSIKLLSVVLLAGMLATMSACSKKEKEQEAVSQTSAVQAADTQAAGGQNTTAAAAAGQANSTQISDGQAAGQNTGAEQNAGAQEAAGGANVTAAAAGETQEQAAAATVPAGDLPQVTENPTDESLTEGYSCMYIASAENADKIEWRAASPDGKTDVPYSAISEYFPYLERLMTGEEWHVDFANLSMNKELTYLDLGGNPKVTSAMIKKYGSKFSDVDKSYTHFKAIVWAVSKGLINGYSDGTFKPNGTLTRNNVATILWKYAGSPKVANPNNPFSDVKKSAAIAWGKSKDIFIGTKFQPKTNCLRGDFALFLYRYDKNVGK